MSEAKVIQGDCLEVLRGMEDNSVDAVVCDPPYGLSNTTPAQVADTIREWATGNTEYVPHKRGGFMGKAWDSFVPPPAVWDECLRVLKPGGHLVAFAGSRTQDLMGLSIRLAGFEMRDSLAWLYGSGFPKSHDVSKAIDRMAGAEREVTGRYRAPDGGDRAARPENLNVYHGRSQEWNKPLTAPATPEAVQWDGWGTALKPAFEPIVLARKPLAEKTVARNVLAHGTGAINVDACRIGLKDDESAEALQARSGGVRGFRDKYVGGVDRIPIAPLDMSRGRWPANVLLDHHAAAWVDEQSGTVHWQATNNSRKGSSWGVGDTTQTRKAYDAPKHIKEPNTGGGASRFFYVAKAPKSERPTYTRPVLRLRDNLTPAQADHVRARLQEAGISLD